MSDMPTNQKIKFPNNIGPADHHIKINTAENQGAIADVYIHEIARKLPIYNTEIECDALGKDKEGKGIAVNTLGRWVFGVPGYQANIRIVTEGNTISIYYPKKAPGLVSDLLGIIKSKVEQEGRVS